MLNYFTTLGKDIAGCTAYNDRAGNGITTRSCSAQNGPRGAWDGASLARQQAKIVNAITTLNADVVGLMEIENSLVVDGPGQEDEAVSTLVDALNTKAGQTVWAFVPSSTDLPAASEMDVISNAIIYQMDAVTPKGDSHALGDLSGTGQAFVNAREPIAQAFTPEVGGTPFAVVVNHFKSKGSAGPLPGDADAGDGQGASNASRIAQATALSDWIATLQDQTDTTDVFLAGDFNAYTQEDPMQVLYDAGWADVNSNYETGKQSYSFGGMNGSLDHVLANASALARTTGADIWNINAPESIALEYSRYNSHGTLFYDDSPYRSSDHDPVLLGLNSAAPVETTTDVQIIGSNDYHGRLPAGPRLAAAVKAARAENPDTLFAAAGDLIGATTFESFIQHDKPTIDVMNEAGLEVSAVGNHEFDAGYDDLMNRVIAPYDATTNPEGGAEWKYLGANVKMKADDSDALDATWIRDFGDVEVGFIGAVTEDLPSLVAADDIADIKMTDIVAATNAAAIDLKADGADVVVLLVHEGAANPSYAAATDPNTTFGKIVNGVDANVDAIISGHTHQLYNHSVPVPEWVTEDRPVTERPVVSAGQYGENLNKLVFTVDNATGEVQAKNQTILPFASFPSPGDAATQAIVTAANAEAAVLGAAPLGKIQGPFSRAKFSNGTSENRGGESTLGNKVAEVHRWATDADIAFMNPGGLRADMVGTDSPNFPSSVTYKNAADVQPFANTLVTMDLTGASLAKVLEQQWQRTAGGAVPTRPFLKLGLSDGFEYTYDPTRPEGDRIIQMTLDGQPVGETDTYKVAANAFLASGTGDNFFAFAEATKKRDSGKVDLQAMVDYMAAFAPISDPLDVDYAQRAVGVAGALGDYVVGEQVDLDLTSLSMTGVDDLRDTMLTGSIDGKSVGEFGVTTTIPVAGDGNSSDEAGTATVAFGCLTSPAACTSSPSPVTRPVPRSRCR